MKNKIFKKLGINTDAELGEAGKLKDNFEQLRKNESIICYSKILEHYLSDVYAFTYKFGVLFLNDKELFGQLCEVFKQVNLDFVKKVNDSLKNTITTYYKNYTVNLDSCKNYFNLIEPCVVLYRAVRFLEEKLILVNFKFDSPVKIRFSENTYKDIMMMLSTFPKPDVLKSSLGAAEKDFNSAYYLYAFERDLRIYQYFNVKVEDFAYGYLFYES